MIIGSYSTDGIHGHIYHYDGSSWTTIEMPEVEGMNITGISGNYIVGWCPRGNDEIGINSFLYDGPTWTTIDMPVDPYHQYSILAQCVSGNKIAGYYTDYSQECHGFIYTIPEPATLLFLGLGTGLLCVRRRI